MADPYVEALRRKGYPVPPPLDAGTTTVPPAPQPIDAGTFTAKTGDYPSPPPTQVPANPSPGTPDSPEVYPGLGLWGVQSGEGTGGNAIDEAQNYRASVAQGKPVQTDIFGNAPGEELGKPPVPATPSTSPDAVDPSMLEGMPVPRSKRTEPSVSAGGIGGGGGPSPAKEYWKVGKSVRDKFDEADKLADAAVANRAKSEDEQANAEISSLLSVQAHEQARAEALEAKEKSRQAVLQSYQEQADRLAEEAEKQTIDSKRFWKNMDTGHKILTIIGLAMGGFVAGATGRNVGASDMIDAAIARDIDEQKANISLKHEAANAKRGLLKSAMERYDNERVAETATHAAYLKAVDAELARLQVGSKSAEQKNRIEELRASLAEKRAMRLATFMGYIPEGMGGSSGGPAHDKLTEPNVKWLAEQEAKWELPQTNMAADKVISIYSSPSSRDGTNAFAAGVYNKSPWVYQQVYGQGATAREQDWQSFRNQSIKALSGSGVSGSEMTRMTAQLDAANDPASRIRAAQSVKDAVAAQRANIYAGVRPQDVAEYAGRRNIYQQPAPNSAPPPAGFSDATAPKK